MDIATSGENVESVKRALIRGRNTPQEIASESNVTEKEASAVLDALTEAGALDRSEDGYSVTGNLARYGGVSEEKVDDITLDRSYDFGNRVPSDLPEYREVNSEKTEILADIRANRQIANEDPERARQPRYFMSGPTGSGKTFLAHKVAEELEAPIITIQGRYSMDERSLKGSTVVVNGDTMWVDGPLTQALIASQYGPVVLLIDEVNRARPEAKSVLYRVLDERCALTLENLGGEVIEGNPMNLISIGTINEGREYHTQKMDIAEVNRLGNELELQFLGLANPDEEAQLLMERAHVPEEMASFLVETANALREESMRYESGGEIMKGLPTGILIDWARTSVSYDRVDEIDNPVIKAFKSSVLRPFYRNENQQWILDTVSERLDGSEVENFSEWTEGGHISMVQEEMQVN